MSDETARAALVAVIMEKCLGPSTPPFLMRTIGEQIAKLLVQHDAQLVADLETKIRRLEFSLASQLCDVCGERTEESSRLVRHEKCMHDSDAEISKLVEERVADLTKPSPCGKPGHRMADCKRMMRLPKNQAYPHFAENHVENVWCQKSGCEPVFICGLCEREERERAEARLAEHEQICPACMQNHLCHRVAALRKAAGR